MKKWLFYSSLVVAVLLVVLVTMAGTLKYLDYLSATRYSGIGGVTPRWSEDDLRREMNRLDTLTVLRKSTLSEIFPVLLRMLPQGGFNFIGVHAKNDIGLEEYFYCEDICPDYGKYVILYQNIKTKEDCAKIGGSASGSLFKPKEYMACFLKLDVQKQDVSVNNSSNKNYELSLPASYHPSFYSDDSFVNYNEKDFEIGNPNGVKIQIQIIEDMGDLTPYKYIEKLNTEASQPTAEGEQTQIVKITPIGTIAYHNQTTSGPGGVFDKYYAFSNTGTSGYRILVWGKDNDREKVKSILSSFNIKN